MLLTNPVCNLTCNLLFKKIESTQSRVRIMLKACRTPLTLESVPGDEGDTQQVSDDDNSSAQIPIQAKQKGKKKGKAAKQANFAALSALDDDPELDAENDQIEEADVPANGGVELNTGFAALNIEDSKDEVQSPVTEGRGSSAFAALDQEGSDQEVSREASTTATLSVEDEEGDPLSAQQLQNGHKKVSVCT